MIDIGNLNIINLSLKLVGGMVAAVCQVLHICSTCLCHLILIVTRTVGMICPISQGKVNLSFNCAVRHKPHISFSNSKIVWEGVHQIVHKHYQSSLFTDFIGIPSGANGYFLFMVKVSGLPQHMILSK